MAAAVCHRSPGCFRSARSMHVGERFGVSGRSVRTSGARLGEVLLEHHRLVAVHEGRPPGEALEEHAGEGVDVAPVVDLLERA